MKKRTRFGSERIFIVLLIVVLVLATLNVAKVRGYLLPDISDVRVDDNIINLSSMSLEQKIAQMVIVHGASYNMDIWKKLQVGGIHFFAMNDAAAYTKMINNFQDDMKIPFFVTADLEGCINPFGNFRSSIAVSEINNTDDAYNKGFEDGSFLKEVGFSLNFAPVVDLDDKIWGCRTFPGNETEVAELASSYSKGLRDAGIFSTAKHFPGKTLVSRDPHKNILEANISEKDLYPYNYLVENNAVDNIMVSHQIVDGYLDSEGRPAVVSEHIIAPLKNKFEGLIISDDTMMLGIRKFYNLSNEQMYIDLVNAGNDLIINFNDDTNEIYHMIQVIKRAVESGIIPEEKIDNSVSKILTDKGFEVIY